MLDKFDSISLLKCLTIVCVIFLFTLDIVKCQQSSKELEDSEDSCLRNDQGKCKLEEVWKTKGKDNLVVPENLKHILKEAKDHFRSTKWLNNNLFTDKLTICKLTLRTMHFAQLQFTKWQFLNGHNFNDNSYTNTLYANNF